MQSLHRGRRAGLRVGASALALVLTAISGRAMAQDQSAKEAESGLTVEDIIVTAQFREQSLQSTPIAITAVNAEMLARRGQTDVTAISSQAPNVTLTQGGPTFGGSLQASIRGIGQFDFNAALEPGVGMYVDDVYYASLTGAVFDLLDLDRVEILRGPQGTLAGRNSIGGSVRLFSKKPVGAGGYVEATYGGLNMIDVRASADMALVQDKLFLRVSGVSKSRDGYVTRLDYACSHPGSRLPTHTSRPDCVLGKEGGYNVNGVRGALRWVATDNLEVNVLADYTSSRSSQANTLIYANEPTVQVNGVPYDSRFIPPNPYISYATFTMPANLITPGVGEITAPDSTDLRGWGVSGTIDWSPTSDISVKSISAVREFTNDFAQDLDASPLPVILGIDHMHHKQFSQELRLNGTVLKKIQYTLGAYYFTQDTVYTTRQMIDSFGLEFIGVDPVHAKSRAFFANATVPITDKLEFVGGVRQTHEEKTLSYARLNPDGSAQPGSANGLGGKFSGSHWDYRGVLNYRFSPDVMVYGQVSTGFKGGGVNPRPLAAKQVRAFGPETLTAYELGLKSSLFDRKVRFNLSAFFNKYKDVQLILLRCDQYSPFPGFPCALPANAGDADVKGVEAETEIHLGQGLEIDGSVSYLDFKYTRLDSNVGIAADMTTPFTPKWKGSLGIQYEVPIGTGGSITPRLDFTYQSSFFTDPVNRASNAIESVALLNGRIAWRPENSDWEAAIAVTNLTDKFYYSNKRDNTGFGIGNVTGTPVVGRQWSVTVKRRF